MCALYLWIWALYLWIWNWGLSTSRDVCRTRERETNRNSQMGYVWGHQPDRNVHLSNSRLKPVELCLLRDRLFTVAKSKQPLCCSSGFRSHWTRGKRITLHLTCSREPDGILAAIKQETKSENYIYLYTHTLKSSEIWNNDMQSQHAVVTNKTIRDEETQKTVVTTPLK